jgi:hypothetical protein
MSITVEGPDYRLRAVPIDEFIKEVDEKDPLVRYPDGRISYVKWWQGWSLDPARAVLCAPGWFATFRRARVAELQQNSSCDEYFLH